MGAFGVGEIPWARRQPRGMVCPFCGNATVTVSLNDLEDDPVRLELYCDSDTCEAREFTVLLLRGNLRQDLVRADVEALRTVDDGTKAEQREDGLDGIVDLNVVLAGYAVKRRAVLERRQRPTRITVELLPDRRTQVGGGSAELIGDPADPR
jgi:hypothetical protein